MAPRPTTIDELRDAILTHPRLAIRGSATKAAIGRASLDAVTLDMRGFAGVIDYDPPELVLTVGAGTPLAEVAALVAAESQMLAFEPFDHAAILGGEAAATIGGVVAAGVAGPQRPTCGGPRDHLLGFEAVSGRGERFIAGGRVVKNVTGYDLSKLVAGSWGRLVALTQLTLKVLPRPRTRTTALLHGLDPAAAIRAMARAMGSQAEVAAAAHVPTDGGTTALRLQGFPVSVAARRTMIETLFAGHEITWLDEAACLAFWHDVAVAAPLPADRPLWRIVLPPHRAPALIAPLGDGAWLADWAGGLIWAGTDMDPLRLRALAADAGGHATLVRAPEAMRDAVPALHPQPPGVAALEERVRRAFDPAGVFETGRF